MCALSTSMESTTPSSLTHTLLQCREQRLQIQYYRQSSGLWSAPESLFLFDRAGSACFSSLPDDVGSAAVAYRDRTPDILLHIHRLSRHRAKYAKYRRNSMALLMQPHATRTHRVHRPHNDHTPRHISARPPTTPTCLWQFHSHLLALRQGETAQLEQLKAGAERITMNGQVDSRILPCK